ncbi:hypothetical protein PV-S19_0062 [Pacmanvirus S19]|nr:hypothetical protein PV-S19_0062 [Pacmanvirus S19]
MYTKINIIPNLEPDAEKFILDNDRMLYKPFFEETEKFCAEKDVLIGGRVGIDLIIGKKYTKDSFFWELYTDDTFNTSKQLADALFHVRSPHVNSKTVALRTDIRNKEFTLFINARMMFKIYSLDRYRGLKLSNLMGPAIRESYFSKVSIKTISEEMQLIEIYRTLYTPAKISQWQDELFIEEKIYNMIKDSVGEKAVKKVTGGRENRFNRTGAEEDIIRKLLTNSKNILIGDYALSTLNIEDNPSRLQFISDMSIDSLAKSVENILAKDRKVKFNDIKVTYIKYPLNLPNDFQITKHTLYINTGKEQIAIADVFNSTQFEMVPYWEPTTGLKIGNPWVLLRFQFIDIWVLRLILNIGTDKSDFMKGRIKSIATRADRIRRLALSSEPNKIFQLENYSGQFINENVAKKKLIKELGERFQTYYPVKFAAAKADEELAED